MLDVWCGIWNDCIISPIFFSDSHIFGNVPKRSVFLLPESRGELSNMVWKRPTDSKRLAEYTVFLTTDEMLEVHGVAIDHNPLYFCLRGQLKVTLYAEKSGNVAPLHAIISTMLTLAVFFRNRQWTCICVLHCTVDIVGKLCRTQVARPQGHVHYRQRMAWHAYCVFILQPLLLRLWQYCRVLVTWLLAASACIPCICIKKCP